MTLSHSTTALLAELDTASRGQLKRRDDLGALLDLGSHPDRTPALEDLAFRAKFLTKTLGIMRRIGPDGNGYERLESEFTSNMETARGHLRTLLAGADEPARTRMTGAYLAMTSAAMENLLALLGDLACYKNLLLDRKGTRA
jgi:hypothetical protein